VRLVTTCRHVSSCTISRGVSDAAQLHSSHLLIAEFASALQKLPAAGQTPAHQVCKVCFLPFQKADSPHHFASYACRSPQDTDCLKEQQFLFLTSGRKLLHSCQQEMLQVCILTVHEAVEELSTAPVHAAVLILWCTIISCLLSRGFCTFLTVLQATLGNHGHGLMRKADMLHAGLISAVDAVPISCCCRPVGGDQVSWANQSLAGPWVTPTRRL